MAWHYERKARIKDGKRVVVKEKVYDEPCKDGYKRDPDTGQCIKMRLSEQRNRSLAAKKSANKASTKRNKNISDRRRDALVNEDNLLDRHSNAIARSKSRMENKDDDDL